MGKLKFQHRKHGKCVNNQLLMLLNIRILFLQPGLNLNMFVYYMSALFFEDLTT